MLVIVQLSIKMANELCDVLTRKNAVNVILQLESINLHKSVLFSFILPLSLTLAVICLSSIPLLD